MCSWIDGARTWDPSLTPPLTRLHEGKEQEARQPGRAPRLVTPGRGSHAVRVSGPTPFSSRCLPGG